jgi:[ribosomal protein S5]-alanine N-acetyltransferase
MICRRRLARAMRRAPSALGRPSNALIGRAVPRIPSFATDRLILRPPSPGDLEDSVALGADPEVMRYLGNGQPQTREQAAAWLEAVLSDARHGFAVPQPVATPGWLVIVERMTNSFVGLAALQSLAPIHAAAAGPQLCPPGQAPVEVGYRLARPFWGKGYATEAGGALVRYGFETLRLPAICGIAEVRNVGSNRVLAKVGCTLRGMYDFKGRSINFHSVMAGEYGGRGAGLE